MEEVKDVLKSLFKVGVLLILCYFFTVFIAIVDGIILHVWRMAL